MYKYLIILQVSRRDKKRTGGNSYPRTNNPIAIRLAVENFSSDL